RRLTARGQAQRMSTWSTGEEVPMTWSIEGRYFENCSCEVVCPCTASLALGADNDYCRFALVFHIDRGEIDGVDVSGVTVAALGETGKYMHEGNWRLGVLMDEDASEEQA